MSRKIYLGLILLNSLSFSVVLSQNTLSEDIRINQMGFYPSSKKVGIVVSPETDKFFILSESLKDTLFSGKLKKSGTWEYSNETVSQADFSKFNKQGTYVMAVPGKGHSFKFSIKPQVHLNVGKASVKAFYYQRASTELLPEHAGKWARRAGHLDTSVIIHNSAASGGRPVGTRISSSKGWYDAGDYNKYIVNSGISMYTLLALYEDFPTFLDTLKLNIPESKNQVPDYLDEVLWNLRWMLTMQDPSDGGVYHKLTNANFDGSEQPYKAVRPRYVVVKTTTATFDFAAVMAQANKVFSKFKKQLPGLADSCLTAAVKAYEWGLKNPEVLYNQNELKEPRIATGAYDDRNPSDEKQWAAAELLVTTGKVQYVKDIDPSTNGSIGVPTWQTVNTLGLYTLAKNAKKLATIEGLNTEAISEAIVGTANEFIEHMKQSPYAVAMGVQPGNFSWGSNSNAANQGMLFIQAYLLKKNPEYIEGAIAELDYLLGRNATAYSFVTGYGEKSTKDPHHRPSESDTVAAPIPGLLAGGPNPGQQDKCQGYPSDLPAKSYVDHRCSYASNEIAINWNAPFAYLSLALEAIMGKK